MTEAQAELLKQRKKNMTHPLHRLSSEPVGSTTTEREHERMSGRNGRSGQADSWSQSPIAEAERLLAGITPGDWRAATAPHPEAVRLRKEAVAVYGPDCLIYSMARDYVCLLEVFERQKRDAEFIAAAPRLVRELLALLQATNTRSLPELDNQVTPEFSGVGGEPVPAMTTAPEDRRCDCSVHLHCGRCHGTGVEARRGERLCLDCGFREGVTRQPPEREGQ